jgi:hypothetical protein
MVDGAVCCEPFSVNRKVVDTLAAVDNAAVDTGGYASIKHRSRKEHARLSMEQLKTPWP